MNKYLKTTVDYSNPNTLYLNGNDDENFNPEEALDITSETFFKVKTDFLFEAPKKITISSKTTEKDHIRKTILLRISPSLEANSEDIIIETK